MGSLLELPHNTTDPPTPVARPFPLRMASARTIVFLGLLLVLAHAAQARRMLADIPTGSSPSATEAFLSNVSAVSRTVVDHSANSELMLALQKHLGSLIDQFLAMQH